MFPLVNTGFFAANGGDVCPPYPIPLPFITGLISHSSAYNICDLYAYSDKTLPLSEMVDPEDARCAWIEDLSGNDLPMLDGRLAGFGDNRSARYKNDESLPYLHCDTADFNGVTYKTDIALRWNTDIKTVIFLVRFTDVLSHPSTRMQQNQFQIRFITGVLQVWDGAPRTSTLLGSNDTWHIVSCRADSNLVLGLDKSYEQVKGSNPSVVNQDHFVFGGTTHKINGDLREVLVFEDSISDSDLDDISDWLTDKWAL